MAEIKPGDTAYEIPEMPGYDPVIRALKTSDPANADTAFNPLFGQIINNIHAVYQSAGNQKFACVWGLSLSKVCREYQTGIFR